MEETDFRSEKKLVFTRDKQKPYARQATGVADSRPGADWMRIDPETRSATAQGLAVGTYAESYPCSK